MATNPSGLHGALFDPSAANGTGALCTGIGFGINAVYGEAPVGIEDGEIPVIHHIGLGTTGDINAVGFPDKLLEVVTATGTVADGSAVEPGFINETETTVVAGQIVLGVSTGQPINTAAPTISGVAQSGQTLTGDNGTWTGSPTYALQWLQDDAVLVGETASTLLLGAGHVGGIITFEVTATNAFGSTIATSAGVGPVVA